MKAFTFFLSDFDECNNGSKCTGRDQLKHIVFSIYFNFFYHATSKNYISAVIYSAI